MISIDFKQLFSVQSQKPIIGVYVSQLWIVSILLTALIATFTIASHLQPMANAVSATSTPTIVEEAPVSPVVVPAEPATTATPTPVTTKPVAPANCTPADASTRPSAINLSAAVNGLTQLVDTPRYYQIFGNTPAQIQAQLRTCAPHNDRGETFAGETSYTLTWQYTPYASSDGLCMVSNVKVGLHVTMTLPSWSATAQAASGLSGKWSNFINNLTLHENGHAALDAQYANQLLNSLQNYPATNCATLNADVQTKVNEVFASLSTANTAYDNHTDHGATQGAILP